MASIELSVYPRFEVTPLPNGGVRLSFVGATLDLTLSPAEAALLGDSMRAEVGPLATVEPAPEPWRFTPPERGAVLPDRPPPLPVSKTSPDPVPPSPWPEKRP